MVIAGDLYDGDWKDHHRPVLRAPDGAAAPGGYRRVPTLRQPRCRKRVTRGLRLPDNVQVFPARRAETFRIAALQVALHGQSFKHAAATDNLVPGCPRWCPAGSASACCTAWRAAPSTPATPCSQAGLRQSCRYWALRPCHARAGWNRTTTIAMGILQRPDPVRGPARMARCRHTSRDADHPGIDRLEWMSALAPAGVDASQADDLPMPLPLWWTGRWIDYCAIEPARMVLMRVRFAERLAAHRDAAAQRPGNCATRSSPAALNPNACGLEGHRSDTQPLPLAQARQRRCRQRLRRIAETWRAFRATIQTCACLQTGWLSRCWKSCREVFSAGARLAAAAQQSEEAAGRAKPIALSAAGRTHRRGGRRRPLMTKRAKPCASTNSSSSATAAH